jgi:hypothetical protein
MAKDGDETPRPSLRSIPPIARGSIPPAPPEPPTLSTSLWAVGAIGLACFVALGAPHLGFSSHRAYGAGAEVDPAESEPGPGLRTVVVQDAPLHRMAEPTRPDGRRGVALVPRSAVARMDGRNMVFVADSDLRLLVATPVELGATEGDQQRVLSGVSAGQRVVAEGVSMLQHQNVPRAQ